ncbi:hypothetical protein [Lysinibacillus xylanilyticus]|uniref:hypothetical protein n=1 Tax=Lysinibacillus xylanilyticus TaxID=582475 RepID=UPI0036D9E356
MTKRVLLFETGGNALYITDDLSRVVLKNYRDSIIMSLYGFDRLLSFLEDNEDFKKNFTELNFRHRPTYENSVTMDSYSCVLNVDRTRICKSPTIETVLFIDEYNKQILVSLEFLDIARNQIEEYKKQLIPYDVEESLEAEVYA